MIETEKPLLIGESFSPWTQKARWALEICGVAFAYREYTPTVSEPALRWRLRQWRGAVSVPVLFADGGAIRDSWHIARYAAARAGDDRLHLSEAATAWNRRSEAALAEARMRVVRAVAADPAAQDEALAALRVPAILRPGLRAVARDAARRLERKYAHLLRPGALRAGLEAARAALTANGGDYLLGRFSYADIAMAVVLEAVAPVAATEPPLGPATRRCWQDPALASAFPDLLRWRARLAADPATTYSQLRR